MKRNENLPITPPRWIRRLLTWFHPENTVEEVSGDLDELYDHWHEKHGKATADLKYALNVISVLPPFVRKRKQSAAYQQKFRTTPNFQPAMILNYFKIAWRNIAHNKSFSSINILGLALGMACSLLIMLWIQDEFSMDSYHANGPQLYHVMERQFFDGKVEATPGTPGLLADELKKEFPEIAYSAGLSWQEERTFSVGEKVNKEKGRWAGEDWFKMYSIPLLTGTAEDVLSSPTNIAISRKLAENYFGNAQAAMGKSIRMSNQEDYQVSAVFEMPENSSVKYDYLLSWKDLLAHNEWLKDWGNSVTETHIQLHTDGKGLSADPGKLEAKIKSFLKTRNPNMGSKGFDIQLFLQPSSEAYLYSNFKNGYLDGGRIEYVRLFGIVAIFILLIACINFMNLATARSVKRAREVGVRKVVGAGRGWLIGQFVGEALVLTFIALLVAVVFVWGLLPTFNTLTEKHITFQFADASFWLTLLAMTLLTGLIAGSYPALFLSSLNPIRVLKGSIRFGSGARFFRQGLVVFQFALSMLLIIGTVVVYRQMDFIQTKNLGFDRQGMVYIPSEGELLNKYDLFKEELLQMPGIEAVTKMEGTPTNGFGTTGNVQWPGKDPSTNIQFQFSQIDYDFTKTLKVKVKGRDFSRAFGADSMNYIINETAAKRIGYQDPVGKPLTMWGKTGTIVGVVDDYHQSSMHTAIEPFIARLGQGKMIIVRIRPGQTKQAMASLESLCREINPKFPFAYMFADEAFQSLYRSETVVGTLANYFAFLAIFICCLGLFGLAAFTAEQRTKEIGVRKVLGASVTGIVALLSKDFLKLVLIAIVIASPIAWYAMNQWLRDFVYRIDMEWWVFVLAGLLAVTIALLTVSFQSVKAALMNPVKTLRSE
ncbi:ABC transporter permease [Dyadobacter pollutisoli]|uniref:ABC transporter permease n=1 Tax=Dyadobacter pollutisoli TaxID=2910158 RepID=A0A9E8NGN3_9BACT|nr:ABC transporter permease [Dyadobacter pollutisoli]WAC14662.1 ABC transporter permease [Dyadobacter pollutisoli]